MVGRYDHIDGELGMVMEPEVLPEDIYPFHLVDTTSPPTTTSSGEHHQEEEQQQPQQQQKKQQLKQLQMQQQPGVKGSCASFLARTRRGKALDVDSYHIF